MQGSRERTNDDNAEKLPASIDLLNRLILGCAQLHLVDELRKVGACRHECKGGEQQRQIADVLREAQLIPCSVNARRTRLVPPARAPHKRTLFRRIRQNH